MPALGTERYEITHKRSAQAINAPCPHSLLFGPLSAVVVSAGKTPDVETNADDNGTDCAVTEQTPSKAKIVNDKREHDIVEPTKKNKSSKKNVNLIKKNKVTKRTTVTRFTRSPPACPSSCKGGMGLLAQRA